MPRLRPPDLVTSTVIRWTRIFPFQMVLFFCTLFTLGLLFGGSAANKSFAVPVVENRFIAIGVVEGIVKNDINEIAVKVEKVRSFYDFPNFGSDYEGQSISILSEMEVPRSIKAGSRVFLVVRVSGHEWGIKLIAGRGAEA